MGPEGIFEMVKEQLDPANILSMVLDAAVDYLIEALISAVTPRIIALFNPAGAIIQAIEAIYRVLNWIFTNAARIFSLIETVVNGVTDLIAGNTSGMANAVESALARLLTPVIDFLAGYLGLGDLPEKIADVIRGFQQRVLAIVEQIIGFLAERARALLGALGIGAEEEPDERTEQEKQADLDRGLAEATALLENDDVSTSQVRGRLPDIKATYRLTSLEVVVESEREGEERVHIEGEINPSGRGRSVIKPTGLPELDALGAQLVLRESKIYFNEKVQELGPAAALELFKAQDARTDTVHPGLRGLRQMKGVGPNINHSPTVAILSGRTEALGEVSAQGASGQFDSYVPSKLRLNAQSKTHAEGRCLARMAAAMDPVDAFGGSATVFVDKPPCGPCSGIPTSMKREYGVDVSFSSP
jgi:hypothetical protein